MRAEDVTNLRHTWPRVQELLDEGKEPLVLYSLFPDINALRSEDWELYYHEPQPNYPRVADVFIVDKSAVSGNKVEGLMEACGNLARIDYDTWLEFVLRGNYPASFPRLTRAERKEWLVGDVHPIFKTPLRTS